MTRKRPVHSARGRGLYLYFLSLFSDNSVAYNEACRSIVDILDNFCPRFIRCLSGMAFAPRYHLAAFPSRFSQGASSDALHRSPRRKERVAPSQIGHNVRYVVDIHAWANPADVCYLSTSGALLAIDRRGKWHANFCSRCPGFGI